MSSLLTVDLKARGKSVNSAVLASSTQVFWLPLL